MFRRPIIVAPTIRQTITEHRHVTEQRAPTDDSVRLLGEMMRAAEARVIQAVTVGDTTFTCVVHTWMEAASDRFALRAVFSLNGRKLVADHSAPRGTRPAELVQGLRDAIALTVAGEALAALDGLPNMLKGY